MVQIKYANKLNREFKRPRLIPELQLQFRANFIELLPGKTNWKCRLDNLPQGLGQEHGEQDVGRRDGDARHQTHFDWKFVSSFFTPK